VTTRDIRPSTEITLCDVCGRTLLRGERAEAYLHGGARRWVCELCKSRALHEGWIREGTVPEYDGGNAGSERRRSLLARWRSRRAAPASPDDGFDEGFELDDAPDPVPALPEPPALPGRRRSRDGRAVRDSRPPLHHQPRGDSVREPRNVRAVPASPEHKTASAVQLFNSSEHPRTVAGVARSLGLPAVSVIPSPTYASLVNVVVSWELCWYRYEVDLSEEVPSVRVAAQGYELEELTAEERLSNALATEYGTLEFG
jgi:hypothetical protein